jgi:hypothetical protein
MKTNKIISIIISIALLVSASKCEFTMETPTYNWFIENKSNHDINFFLALGIHSLEYIFTEYPDTILPNQYISKDSIDIYKIISGTKQLIYISINKKWEDCIKELSADTLSVYIFHTDTLQKYTWEEVRQDYKILRRYDLSSDDITSLRIKNGAPVITYPPDDRMKNMKMYPPYGQ